jgi:hypothetical protein
MPGFGGKATDIAAFTRQVMELANYLLQHYGNAAYSVTPQMVGKSAADKLQAITYDLGRPRQWLAGALMIAPPWRCPPLARTRLSYRGDGCHDL